MGTLALMSTCELHLYTPGVSVNPLMSPAPRSTKLGGVRSRRRFKTRGGQGGEAKKGVKKGIFKIFQAPGGGVEGTKKEVSKECIFIIFTPGQMQKCRETPTHTHLGEDALPPPPGIRELKKRTWFGWPRRCRLCPCRPQAAVGGGIGELMRCFARMEIRAPVALRVVHRGGIRVSQERTVKTFKIKNTESHIQIQ